MPLRRDLCSGGELGIFCNHNNAIPDGVKLLVDILRITWEGSNHDTLTNSHILIEYRGFDMTIFPNPDRQVAARLFHIILVGTHKNTILDHRSFRDLAADSNNGMRDLGFTDSAAFRDQDIF